MTDEELSLILSTHAGGQLTRFGAHRVNLCALSAAAHLLPSKLPVDYMAIQGWEAHRLKSWIFTDWWDGNYERGWTPNTLLRKIIKATKAAPSPELPT